MTASAGYSGTPLARKLSLKTGMRLFWDGVPDSVADEIRAGLADEDATVTMLREPTAPLDAAHVFVTGRGNQSGKVRRRHRLLPVTPRIVGN